MNSFFELNDMYFYAIEDNKQIKNSRREYQPIDKAALGANANLIIDDYLEFYEISDGFQMEWKADQDKDEVGRIRIQRLNYFLGGLKLENLEMSSDDSLYNFHPLDLLSDEAHCGVFITDKIEDRMYFHMQGEDELHELQISFKSYMNLANEARGYFYWQKYLLEILSGESNPESENFKKNMPKLFPDFSLDAFTEKFNGFII